MPDPSSALLTIPETLPACNFDDAARLEFQAALQLLAERACFLAAAQSCAIALEQDGILQYCAAAGNTNRDLGTIAPLDLIGIRECLATLHPASITEPAVHASALFVPVLRDNKPVGFFELMSSYEFELQIQNELVRLAGLAAIAQELRDAAVNATTRILQDSQSLPAPRPVLWHAPEKASSRESCVQERIPESSSAALGVSTCTSCGFPVSPGRSLCIECERNPAATIATSAQIFTSSEEGSWLRAHGYTIASLLITAATVALILWLRR